MFSAPNCWINNVELCSYLYAVPAWHPGLSEHHHYALERIQKRACRIMLGTKYGSYIDALEQCQLTNLRTRREQICLQFINKLVKSPAFHNWVPNTRGVDTGKSLRNSNLLSIPKTRTERYANSPIPYMVKLWNAGASKVSSWCSFLHICITTLLADVILMYFDCISM